MQKNEVTKLALKLAGIYVLIQAIWYIPSVVSSFRMLSLSIGEAKVGSITLLITFSLLVVLGFWLTFKNKPKFEKEAISSPELLTLGLAIGGLIIFALAISDLPLFISKLVYTSTSTNPLEINGANNNVENVMALIGNLIQLLLGALIFFKAKYFAQLIK
ncbi:hypothetical protein GF354_00580 [Candidatus Peregrinibacteria bacterium]|nr:hypothetical protein [Candidatus Peregrinibacteria bacterium]